WPIRVGQGTYNLPYNRKGKGTIACYKKDHEDDNCRAYSVQDKSNVRRIGKDEVTKTGVILGLMQPLLGHSFYSFKESKSRLDTKRAYTTRSKAKELVPVVGQPAMPKDYETIC
ncbi:hypothetical protein HK099_007377, partial [Clydaea vesicula]